MIAALDDPAIRARVPAMSVEKYHLLFKLGALAPNVELIRGALIEKMPKSPLHASIVTLLFHYLAAQVSRDWLVRSEQPLTLQDSEPEPDLSIVPRAAGRSFSEHPGVARLLIEVCVSSEALDRLKLELYAEAGVPEYWLLLAEERAIERHTGPRGSGYTEVERATWPAALESTVFPGLFLPPADLFGELESPKT